MSELSSHFDIDIGHGVTVKDVIENPDKHHWKLSYRFRGHRNKYDTPNGVPYGTSSSYAKIYASLGDDFIGDYLANDYYNSDVKAYGDELLSRINESIGIYVNTYETSEGEVYNFEKKLSSAKTRYENAYENYESASELFDDTSRKYSIAQTRYDNAQSRYTEAWENLQAEQIKLEDLSSFIPLTKSGNWDKRTREYKDFLHAQAELSDATQAYRKLRYYMDREHTRYENSQLKYDEVQRKYAEAQKKYANAKTRYENAQSRYDNAVNQFENIKNDSFDPRGMFKEASEEFAEAVQEDIIARGENGQLPRQNMLLSEETIKRRMKSAIPGAPRYWATGQLIRAVVIKCTLV